MLSYEPPTYDNGKYQYPAWAHGIGWSFTTASLGCIPVFAVISIIRGSGNTLFEVWFICLVFAHLQLFLSWDLFNHISCVIIYIQINFQIIFITENTERNSAKCI